MEKADCPDWGPVETRKNIDAAENNEAVEGRDFGLEAKEYMTRICRICHETMAPHISRSPVYASQHSATASALSLSTNLTNNLKAGGLGPSDKGTNYELISPCYCRGTMKWVHRMCLDAWRAASTSTDSYSRCEQCGFKYRLEPGWGSFFLSNSRLLWLLSLGLFACMWALAVLGLEVGGRVSMPFWNESFQMAYPKYTQHVEILEELSFEMAEKSGPMWKKLTYGLVFLTLGESVLLRQSIILTINYVISIYRNIFFGTYLDQLILFILLSWTTRNTIMSCQQSFALFIRSLVCNRVRNLAS